MPPIHLYVFFGETSSQVLMPIFFFFFVIGYMSCLCILEINPLLVASFASVLSHSVDRVFIWLMVSFSVKKLLGFLRSH